MLKVCDGFFENPIHLQRHFSYLTDGADISKDIKASLLSHLRNFEVYLLFARSDLVFKEELDKIIDDCNLEFDGSLTHKYIFLLRALTEDFDGKRAGLFRLTEDGPLNTASPSILGVKVGSHYNFELWAEGSRLLLNMDLAEALSAFFQLCFAFNLEFPQEAAYVRDFLQRVVADYGDDGGSLAKKAKSTMENKMARYFMRLGQAASAKKN